MFRHRICSCFIFCIPFSIFSFFTPFYHFYSLACCHIFISLCV
uniref:Uncharacterized protein n=1 Tax=Myoviridae sp. ctj9o3 TaxID=2826688 RepID=A0A8S5MC61_9CAUD|nr:MAG TPA: hypothetical protein [Myoviridae sp. ctj9o3]